MNMRLRRWVMVVSIFAAGATGAFNPATIDTSSLSPSSCQVCLTTFASGFPSGPIGASPFGVLFFPSHKVLVGLTWPTNQLYLFPGMAGPGDLGTNCPTGGGFSAPANFLQNLPGFDRVLDLVLTHNGRIFASGVKAGGQVEVFELLWSAGTFTVGVEIPVPSAYTAGMALDPVTGHVLVVGYLTIFSLDPIPPVPTLAVAATGGPFGQPDGIDVENSGTRAWVADVGNGNVVEFALSHPGGLPALTNPTVLCSFPAADGVARGLNGTCFRNHIAVNDNNGNVNLVRVTGSGKSPCSTLVSGGSRGDFVKVGCNGWMYATQSTSVEIVRDQGGAPAFECNSPWGCRGLREYAQELDRTCGLSGVTGPEAPGLCAKLENLDPSDDAQATTRYQDDITNICTALTNGTLSGPCAERAKALAIATAMLLQDVTGQLAVGFLPAGCPISIPDLPQQP